MNKIRILLADDHAVLQAGLEAMLNAEADMTVVGSASDGHSAVRQAALLQPDVVLLDINMPELNGLEALAQLRVQAPATHVLILTMHDDAQYLRQAMTVGGGRVRAQTVSGQGTVVGDPHRAGVLDPAHAWTLAAPPVAPLSVICGRNVGCPQTVSTAQ